MTYETKMFIRLALPSIAVLGLGLVTAACADMLSNAPVAFGGTPLVSGIGNLVALGSGALALVVYGIGMLRYWRWTRDEGDICFVCGCLLGREREGRFGPYRKCLGCGKNHALGRI